MKSDEELIKISQEIDNTLAIMGLKYDITPLSLSAIVLARLMRMVEETEDRDNFMKIMASAQTVEPPDKRVYQ